jgi:hypothetical protein
VVDREGASIVEGVDHNRWAAVQPRAYERSESVQARSPRNILGKKF